MKKIISPKIALSVLAIVAVLAIIGCGSSIEMISKWKNLNINIDGKNTEWEGGVYIKEINSVVNMYNDANFIYLGIITTDRQLSKKIMMNGFTVWLDRNGNEDKDFGIKFPIGAMNQDMPMMPEMDEENNNKPEKMDNPEKFDEMFEKGMTEYEIIGKGGKTESRIQSLEKNGIEVKIGHSEDKFIYELKMPMKIYGDILYAVGTDTGKVISLGLETGTIDMEKMKQKMGKDKKNQKGNDDEGNLMQESPNSMGGNQMGGGRRQGGGGMGRNFTENQKPLSLWIKTHIGSSK